ncbi:hypothetical protein, partial [Collinsella aerofaciens]|uniref:hypothetical protein n=1 Tax=Collinsella aerofaciens TaxID=74426 RepID=UPI0034A3AB0B
RKTSTKPQETAPENVDASGIRFCSFTSRKSIHLRFRADTNPAAKTQNGARAQRRPRQKR